jgi:hypothetical protein
MVAPSPPPAQHNDADRVDLAQEEPPNLLFDVLEQVHSIFSRHGIWHCLLFGTLLGAVRGGDIIAWDHDLDLLVRPVDVPRIVALNGEGAAEGLAFWSGRGMGYRLVANPGRVAWFDPGFLSIMVDGSSRGELYAPSLFADGVLRFYDFEQEAVFWPEASYPAFVFESLTTAAVRGVDFPVPLHAEQWLEWHYGEDWRTPYRSVWDGGEARSDRSSHGDVSHHDLAAQVAWCEAQGWDRSVYSAQPAWPRELRGAGPEGASARTALTSRSAWWHTIDEVSREY